MHYQTIKENMGIETIDDIEKMMINADKTKNYNDVLNLFCNLTPPNKVWAETITTTALKISKKTDNIASQLLFSTIAGCYAQDDKSAQTATKEQQKSIETLEKQIPGFSSKDRKFLAVTILARYNYTSNIHELAYFRKSAKQKLKDGLYGSDHLFKDMIENTAVSERYRDPSKDKNNIFYGLDNIMGVLGHMMNDETAENILSSYKNDNSPLTLAELNSDNMKNKFSENSSLFTKFFQKIFNGNKLTNG